MTQCRILRFFGCKSKEDMDKTVTVFFDFDGTIAMTKPLMMFAVNEIAKEYGLKPVEDIAKFRHDVCTHAPSLICEIVPLFRKAKKRILDHIEKNITTVNVVPGVKEALAQLQQAGIRIGLITANRESTVKKFLKFNGMLDYFDPHFMVAGRKDKDDVLHLLSLKHNLDRRLTFYVGDERSDMELAKEFAITIAATWGYDKEEALNASKPDFTIEDPSVILMVASHPYSFPIQKQVCSLMSRLHF
jgi:phosphoglycolate phosphatase-like HAD superfamily hydrolase